MSRERSLIWARIRLPAIVIVDLEILRHQAPKRVQRESPDPDFQTKGVEFLGEQGPPMSAEPFMVEIVGCPRKQQE